MAIALQPEELEKLIAHEARYVAFAATATATSCALFLHGPELPEYRDANRALRLRDDGRGPEAVAREVVRFYRERGLPVAADVDAVAEEQGIGAALRRMGVTPVIGARALMRWKANALPELPASGVEIREIARSDAAGMRAWIETAASDAAGDEDEALWRAVAEREAHSPDCRRYLACLDGQPAGACDLFAAEGWGRVDSVVTRPQMRRRGVASALARRAVADSQAMNHAVTYLFAEAGSDAERLYRRLGFALWNLNPFRRHLAF